MQKLFLFILSIGFCLKGLAQQPVNWNYSVKKLDEKLYEIHFTADIKEGWHIYAQHQPKDAIAFPTTIQFNKNPLFSFVGKVQEVGQLEKATIESLGIVQHQYARRVDFVQKIQLKNNVKLSVSGRLKFEACTDEQCLPTAEIPFSVLID